MTHKLPFVWRKGPGKQGLEKGCRKASFGKKDAGNQGLEKVPERKVWKKGAGKGCLDKGCRKARF